jgi:uncharacterized glyoxalase superfamily protein PhnB
MKKLSPVLCVDAIEPSLSFWVDALGFVKTVDVPEGDRVAFAILQKDGLEVMLQTRDSIQNDIPELAGHPAAGSALFIEVEDLEAVARAVADFELIVPRRKTFYGSEEIVLREPGGNVVTFAQFES